MESFNIMGEDYLVVNNPNGFCSVTCNSVVIGVMNCKAEQVTIQSLTKWLLSN